MIVGKLGEHGLQQHRGRRRARGDREAVRHAPGGGARAEPPGAVGARRVAGLSHRPLPGQGDRPEHARVPLRERHVRADLEPQLHRLRPDHGGRGPRHRAPSRLLRLLRRAARPGPEPHAAAAHPALHGAAGDLHRRRGARREGQGAARDPARPIPRRWCAPSTRRASPRARTWSATSTRRVCRTTRRPRPTWRCASRSTTGAGPACRSTCAPASGWRARSRRSP